ncbi:Arylesterase [Legionella massiliensis]|uniref:Arylesterase n=1 Tax=Legionella massiliensis TaxID=1034943 RepID=A0A078KSM5_9GAMM|nr:alpha/beta hydrolase [Legionella massiliensis]CDZ77415.1 Arylesterase [Legionella massiliensis]CEE13153.1 Arylesterase [Legionella massiliensis]
MGYVQVDASTKVFVEDWGSGKPIVFISGWPFDHRCYEYQFTQLPKQGYRCIGIDMRGYGLSDKPWGDYNYNVFADDILKVLRHLDLHDVTLVGHSMGGAIIINYCARHHNERVSSLVLMGAAAPIWTQRPDYPHGFTIDQCNELLNLCYSDRAQLLENFGKIFFYKEDSVSPKFADWMQNMGMEASPYATSECIIALRDTDQRKNLAKVLVPTAIFHSPNDKVCPYGFAEEMHKGIKNSKIIPFEKSGHGLFYDEWEKCNSELMKFVDEHSK